MKIIIATNVIQANIGNANVYFEDKFTFKLISFFCINYIIYKKRCIESIRALIYNRRVLPNSSGADSSASGRTDES